MKKRYLDISKIMNFFKLLIILTIFGFLIEIFIFNFKILTLKKSDKGVIEISDYNKISNDKSTIIKINLKNKYVNKLKIIYKTDKDINVDVEYIINDYYGKNKLKKNSDVFDNEVKLQVLNVRNNAKNISITYDSKQELSIKKIYIDNQFRINFFRVFFVINLLLIATIIYYFYKNGGKSNSIHKYFFIIGMLLGISMIILQPSTTFYSFDDQIHFKNTYELIGNNFKWSVGEYSMLDMKSVGRDSISSSEEQINQMKILNDKSFSGFATQSGRLIAYNQIAYFPSAVTYHFTKLLGIPFSISFKLSKIANLIIYLLIFSYAIKISCVGKRLLTVLGLLPSSLFLACQFSYDSAVISGITLGIVMLVNWFANKEFKVNYKNMTIFLLSMFYATFTKAVYVPFMLLFLFIPKEKFDSVKTERKVKIVLLIIFLLILATFALPSTVLSDTGGDIRGGATNISEQFKLILTHPFSYIMILKNNALDLFSERFMGEFALGGFAYINYIKGNLYYILLIIIMFVTITDNEKVISIKNKLLFAMCTFGTIILIWTALYLSFTPVGSMGIGGVQPRYFIPLFFPLLICFQSKKIKNKFYEKKYNTAIITIMAAIFIVLVYNFVFINYCL